MLNPFTSSATRGIVLGLSAVWALVASTTGLASGEPYTPTSMTLFPLEIGNRWTYGRTIPGGTETVEAVVDREEQVAGNPTRVLQVKKGTSLLEEWYVSNTLGLSLHRARYFDKELFGVPTNITATFNPQIRMTEETPAVGQTKNSTGSLLIQLSSGMPPGFTASYFSSTSIASVGEVFATPGALAVGVRTISFLDVTAPPSIPSFSGTAFADISWANQIGPIAMTLGSTLPGLTAQEKKWLTDTNVDREDTWIVSALSPTSRATEVNRVVTAFAALINGGNAPARKCGFRPLPGADGLQVDFTYFRTDSANNVVGGPDPLVDLAPGEVGTFVFAMTPTEAFDFRRIRFVYDCKDTPPALRFRGLNDFGLLASAGPVADVLMIAATLGTIPGTVDIPGDTGLSAFSVAALNLGVASALKFRATPLDASTPVTLTVCEVNITTGLCPLAPTSEVSVPWGSMESRFFYVFVQGMGNITFDPANIRLVAETTNDQGQKVGDTTVAVQTVPFSF